jgi:hypothetical protein
MMTRKHKKQLVDVSERTAATFAEAFIAVALVSGVSDTTGLKIAGTAGALAAGKFALAKIDTYLHPPPPSQ